ncbi:MAG: lysostaphin resistance A-like protein [Nitrospiraceae bacterium]
MNTDLAHSPPLDQPTDPVSPSIPPVRRFALFPTVLAALVLAGGILALANLVSSTSPLDRVATPDRALALIVNRTMDLEYAIAQTPQWEHVLYEATTGWMDELAQAVAWYEELADASNEPLTLVYLAVLEGEAGHLDRVQDEIKGWDQLPDPFPTYAGLLQAAYLDQAPPDDDRARALREDLADAVPAGWFADRLAISLATHAGNRAWLSEAQENLSARAQVLLWRARVMLAVDLGMILLGTTLAALLLAHRGSAATLTVGSATVPPPWPGSVGAVVLIRGGALWIASMVAMLSLGSTLVRVFAVPLTYLPLLALARRHLLKPAGLGLQDGLGLVPVPSGWSRCWRLVGLTAGAGLLGEWLLTIVAKPLGLSSHWTEGFDEAMIWGNLPDLAASLVETIVFAPVFEEIVFRGLFFATLRRRFGFVASALISASVFAIAHGYGVLGFASVLWSGVLWAWVYERSGSVLPGILAHMINNSVVCLSVILFLR